MEKEKVSFEVLNERFESKFVLRNYDSILWKEEYRSVMGGEFSIDATLTGNPSRSMYDSIVLGDLVVRKDTKIGVITSIDTTSEQGVSTMSISGMMLEGMLSKRNLRVNPKTISLGLDENELVKRFKWANSWELFKDVVSFLNEPVQAIKKDSNQIPVDANDSIMRPINYSMLTSAAIIDPEYKEWEIINEADENRIKNIPEYTIDRTLSVADFLIDILDTHGDTSYEFKNRDDGLKMRFYNGKDISDRVVFSDQSGGIKRLRKLNTVDNLKNSWATMFNMNWVYKEIDTDEEEKEFNEDKTFGGETPGFWGYNSSIYDGSPESGNMSTPWRTGKTLPDGKDTGIFVNEFTSERTHDMDFKTFEPGPSNEHTRQYNYTKNFIKVVDDDSKYLSRRSSVTNTEFLEVELNEGLYRYREDYNLGDLIMVDSSDMNIKMKMKITGVVEMVDNQENIIRDIEVEAI